MSCWRAFASEPDEVVVNGAEAAKYPAVGSTTPAFRLGLIADIQYADCEDGSDFAGLEKRHFRNSLSIAADAVQRWGAEGVQAVVQLGDAIDGCNAKLGTSREALARVLAVLERSPVPRYDLIGNHELYNFKRADLQTTGLRCRDAEGRTYYSAHLGAHWEAIFLDTFEQALIGMPSDAEGFKKAVEIMTANNPAVFDPKIKDWFAGLPQEKHRFVPYNGACSPAQVSWLEGALTKAAQEKRKVLVFSHVPLCSAAAEPKTIAWNFDVVLSVLHRFKDTVVAVLAGHDHSGGYAVDSAGLHHITMCSPMTTPVGSECFALLECYDDGTARFTGHGRACVETNTKGKGRVYTDLKLSKGVQNAPVEGSQLLEGGNGAAGKGEPVTLPL